MTTLPCSSLMHLFEESTEISPIWTIHPNAVINH